MSSLYQGIIDMHIHGSPSLAPRRNTPELMREMGKMGYRAFVLKDHHYPSVGVCSILNQWLEKETGVTACGCIVLNNSVGGLNLYAVDMAVNMGARVVSFPTLSAKCHIDIMSAAHPLAGSSNTLKVQESQNPITVIDERGQLKPEAAAILDYIAENPDICLYTGHLSIEEVDKIADYAFQKGIKKLYANHPYWMICGAPISHIKKWAGMGMYIELNMGVMRPWSMSKYPAKLEDMLELIRTVPNEQLVISTDLGSQGKPLPTEGIAAFFKLLMENGVTERQLSIMAKEVPAYLLGL